MRATLLGGSWVVISGILSPLIWVISIVTLLRTLLITTHEPPSTNVFAILTVNLRDEAGIILYFSPNEEKRWWMSKQDDTYKFENSMQRRRAGRSRN